jgi:DNA-binding MarR family transcriptional regulator
MEKIRNQQEEFVFQAKLFLLASNFLSWNSMKVVLYLTGKRGYDNSVGIDQETIREDLGYNSKQSIVSAIKELNKYNIITSVKDIQDKRRNVYFINPYESWKGELGEKVRHL